MSSDYIANCECGFRKEISVGGLMSTFNEISEFPFFCKSCGLVSVNIASESLTCPSCKSKEIIQYGDERVSTPTKFNQSLQWGKYQCGRDNHFCPGCKKFTMVFSWTGVVSD
jgi:RNA polymerase subunit RPABC4/transcription elongation factor Spt4